MGPIMDEILYGFSFIETQKILRQQVSESNDQTPNEIAEKIDLNQHTVQGALLELMNTKKNIKWKKIGRYRLFWKVK